LAKLSRIKTTT